MSTKPKLKKRTKKKSIYPKVIRDITLGDSMEGEIKLPIHGYCQTDWYRCGVSAGWSVLKYFRPHADFRRFEKRCRPDPTTGTDKCHLQQALRNQGVRTTTKHITFKTIKQSIDDGKPILMSIYTGNHTYHWIVIYGYKEKPKTVFIIGRTIPGFSKKAFPWKKLRKLDNDVLPLIASGGVRRSATGKSNARGSSSRQGPGEPPSDPTI